MALCLTIMRCPQHGNVALSVDDGRGGTRIAGNKCCGRWVTVKEFPMAPEDLLEIANTLECMAAQAEAPKRRGRKK